MEYKKVMVAAMEGGGITWLWLWLWLMANGCWRADIANRTKERANESSRSPSGDGCPYSRRR